MSKKSFKSFLKDIVEPYMKDRGLAKGKVVKLDYAFDVFNEKDPDKYENVQGVVDKLANHGNVMNYMFITDIDLEPLEKKYDGGLEKEYSRLVDETTLHAQEEFNLSIFKTVVMGKFFKYVKELSEDDEEMGRVFNDNIIDKPIDLYHYNVILPEKDKVTCNPKYTNMFDIVKHGTREYASIAKTMLLKEAGNSFRYNFDLVDIQQWARDNGIDVSKYKLIDGTKEDLISRIEHRNNDTFKGVELEHLKPLAHNAKYQRNGLIDQKTVKGVNEDAKDGGARVRVNVKVDIVG